jgi:ribosomal protein S18 acetylase RimI-like enzyme
VIRRARSEDVPGIAEAMGAAFEDDPVVAWFWRRPSRRRERVAGWYDLVARTHYLEHGEVFVAEEEGEIAGCAMWSRPGSWRLSTRAELAATRYAVPRLGLHLPFASVAMRRIEARHPDARHWYLSELGVRPQSQGRGLGSKLMFEILARCDHDGVPAYLESSTERSRALYERHGFRTTEVLQLPRAGPPLWLMWRASGVPDEHADPGDDRTAQRDLDERLSE